MFFNFPMRAGAGLGLLAAALAACPAAAQTLSTNSASYNGGYGRYNGQENRPIENYSNRDANGNMLIVGGLIQGGGASSTTSSSTSAGSTSSWAGGVGGGSSSASAIGNNLSVVTQGNNNVVIVNSTQINTGNISAGALTGGVGNDK